MAETVHPSVWEKQHRDGVWQKPPTDVLVASGKDKGGKK